VTVTTPAHKGPVFLWVVFATFHQHTKFEASSFIRSRDKRGPKFLKMGHVTLPRTLEGQFKIAYQFLFVFHCNCGHNVITLYRYRFRNKTRYWSKNTNFSYPLPFNLHDYLEPLLISFQNFNTNCPRSEAI